MAKTVAHRKSTGGKSSRASSRAPHAGSSSPATQTHSTATPPLPANSLNATASSLVEDTHLSVTMPSKRKRSPLSTKLDGTNDGTMTPREENNVRASKRRSHTPMSTSNDAVKQHKNVTNSYDVNARLREFKKSALGASTLEENDDVLARKLMKSIEAITSDELHELDKVDEDTEGKMDMADDKNEVPLDGVDADPREKDLEAAESIMLLQALPGDIPDILVETSLDGQATSSSIDGLNSNKMGSSNRLIKSEGSDQGLSSLSPPDDTTIPTRIDEDDMTRSNTHATPFQNPDILQPARQNVTSNSNINGLAEQVTLSLVRAPSETFDQSTMVEDTPMVILDIDSIVEPETETTRPQIFIETVYAQSPDVEMEDTTDTYTQTKSDSLQSSITPDARRRLMNLSTAANSIILSGKDVSGQTVIHRAQDDATGLSEGGSPLSCLSIPESDYKITDEYLNNIMETYAARSREKQDQTAKNDNGATLNSQPIALSSTPLSDASAERCPICNLSEASTTSSESLWIRCNGCKSWYHNTCAGLDKTECDEIDLWHCSACVPEFGPSTYRRKSSRKHTTIDYVSLNEGSQAPFKAAGDPSQHPYVEPIGRMQFLKDNFARLKPEQLTLEYFENGDGYRSPVVVPVEFNPRPENTGIVPPDINELNNPDGIGMIIPPYLTVRKVAELVGFDVKVEVLDVLSQSQDKKVWDFWKWVEYFESPNKETVKNVISQEVSNTKLGELIRRPRVVEHLDLAEQVWPTEMAATFPKVKLYCLMSIGGSYTDFHVDFGGSSVFYHVVKGKKVFILVPPTKHNMAKYEAWNKMSDQNSTWFPATLAQSSDNGASLCYRMELNAGDTAMIPSGWIHAVLTPEDSLVIGGNFLTRLTYEQQFKIVDVERNTNVHVKFRYPQFQKVMWFTALEYLRNDPLPSRLLNDDEFSNRRGITNGENKAEEQPPRIYSKYELNGLLHLGDFLLRTALIAAGFIIDITQDRRNRVKASIPKNVVDPLSTVQVFGRWAAWRRGDNSLPEYATQRWTPSQSSSITDKRNIPAKPKKAKKDMDDKRSRPETTPRDGLRKPPPKELTPTPQKKEVIVPTFVSNTKAALERILNISSKPSKASRQSASVTQRSATPRSATPSVITLPTTSEPEPSKPMPHITPSEPITTPVVAQHSPEVSVTPIPNLKTVAYTPPPPSTVTPKKQTKSGSRVLTPKNSSLGPRRTACDTCRRQKVACKHKDLVAKGMPIPPKDPTPVKVLFRTQPIAPTPFTTQFSDGQSAFSPQAMGNAMANNGGVFMEDGSPYKISKNGRPVACESCKKSRRRCTHNGQADFPPARKRTRAPKDDKASGETKTKALVASIAPVKPSPTIKAQARRLDSDDDSDVDYFEYSDSSSSGLSSVDSTELDIIESTASNQGKATNIFNNLASTPQQQQQRQPTTSTPPLFKWSPAMEQNIDPSLRNIATSSISAKKQNSTSSTATVSSLSAKPSKTRKSSSPSTQTVNPLRAWLTSGGGGGSGSQSRTSSPLATSRQLVNGDGKMVDDGADNVLFSSSSSSKKRVREQGEDDGYPVAKRNGVGRGSSESTEVAR